MEVAFQYVNEFHENVLGFCNNIYNSEGGTHLTGCLLYTSDVYKRQVEEFTGIEIKKINIFVEGVRVID